MPAQLLDDGPPRTRPPLPPRLRAQALVVVAVLGTGLLVAGQQQELQRRVRVPVDASTAYLGVSATAQVLSEGPASTMLDLVVRVAPGGAGPGDSDVEPAQQLRLQGVSARGYTLQLTRRGAPLVLDYVGRFARATEQVLHLPMEVVADCAVAKDTRGPILLAVRVTGGPVGQVWVQGGSAVVLALEDLARRSCRQAAG